MLLVYAPGRGPEPEFFAFRAPDDAEIASMVQELSERIPRKLDCGGMESGGSEDSDPCGIGVE